MKSVTSSHSKRLTIGLMMGYFDRLHEDEIRQGISEIAAEADVNLITFVGRHLQSLDGFESYGNIVYQLADLQNVDGLIITTTIIGTFIADAEIRAFLDQYRHIPVVNIGRTHIPGATTVYTGTSQGVREVLDHLLGHHQYQRVAYIGGPETSSSARSRYAVYQDKLAEYGIPLDEMLVAPGDYSLASGHAAVELLVDHRKVKFEALFAANDDMALGAMQALQARGIRVPDDVAIAGIDNKEYARIANPPVTSVGIDFAGQGREAVRILLRKISGESVPDESNVEATRLLVRQSCGCLETPPTPFIPVVPDTAAAQEARLPLLLSQPLPASITPAQIEHLWDAFWRDQQTEDPAFLRMLRRLLQDVVAAENAAADWHQLIAAMRAVLHFDQPDRQLQAENLWQQAHLMISETARQAMAYQHWQANQQMRSLQATGQRLITTFNMDELATVISEELPWIGIRSCFIMLYEPAEQTPPPTSRIAAAFTTSGQTIHAASRLTFPTYELVPAELLPADERLNLVVEPLHFQDEQLGFVVFQADKTPGAIFEALRGYLSSALKGARLLEQAQIHASELEEQVKARTAELTSERNTLRTLIDNLPDHVYMKDLDHRFVLVSQNLLIDSKGTIDVGKTDFDISSAAEATMFSAAEDRLFETGEPLITEVFVPGEVSVYGTPQWLIITKLPMRDPEGNITGLIGINRNVTEQKQFERRLEAERNLLRLVIDNLPDHIYLKDADHRFLLVNKALAEIWPGDMIGKTDHDLMPTARADGFRNEERAMLDSGVPMMNVETHVPPDESINHQEVWNIRSKIPLRDHTGTITRLLGINRDITERKQAELRLEEERNLLRTLIDSLPHDIYMKDHEHRYFLANQMVLNMWGGKLHFGKTDHELLRDPVEIATSIEEEHAILTTGEPILNRELYVPGGNFNTGGHPLWLSISKIPLRDRAGNVTGLIGINQYITEQKQAELRLEEERNLLRTLIDNLPDHIYMKDVNHRFVLVNKALADAWNGTSLIGKTDQELTPGPKAVGHSREERQLFETGQPVLGAELHVPLLPNSPRRAEWFAVTKIPLRDNEGHVSGLVGINRDITKEKNAEIRLEAERSLLRTLIDHLPDHIFVKDEERRFLLVNKTMETDWRTELIGKRDEDISPHNAPSHRREEEHIMETGTALINQENFLTDPDGTPHWLQTTKVPLPDQTGAIIGLVGIVRDISPLKQIQLELEEERNRLRTIIDNIPDLVYMKDTQHRYVLISESVFPTRMGPDLIGKTDEVVITSREELEQAIAEEKMIMETGVSIINRELYVSPEHSVTGTDWWVLISKIPFRDSSGNITGIIGINRPITELKLIQIALEKERNLLRTVIDNLPDHIFVKDREGRFVLANAPLQTRWGQNLIGKSDFDILTRESAEEHYEEERHVLEEGQPLINREIAPVEGELYAWQLSTKVPLYDNAGNITGLVGINRIVTDLKEVQMMLQKERNLLRTLIDNIPDHIYMKDLDHRFVLINEALRKRWGRDITGLTDHDLLRPEMIENTDASEKRIFSSGESNVHERESRDAAGNPLWLLITKVPVRDINGQITGLIGINRNITELKNIQLALMQERNLLRTLIDHLPLEVYAKDRESRFILANRRTLEYTGYKKMEELIDTTDFDSQVFKAIPELAHNHYQAEQAMMRTGDSIIDLVTPPIPSPLQATGNRWVVTTKVPLRDGEGHIVGLVGINQDITERKKHEAEREQLITELEARNTEMERFTYTVSHDLRSPLITIKGFLGLLDVDIARQDADRIKSDLGYIRNASEQMENLLNDLLELSRIGRIVNPVVTITLTDLVTDAVKLVTGHLMQRGVSVTVQPAMPTIKGDRARLLEVFQNLLENAVKYMGTQSQPHIEIGAEQRVGDVLCFVRDNGIGIVADYHETIFELFDQLDPEAEGTGIGLALVRRILEFHGGSIWVESDGPGTGSTFYFTLPLPT